MKETAACSVTTEPLKEVKQIRGRMPFKGILLVLLGIIGLLYLCTALFKSTEGRRYIQSECGTLIPAGQGIKTARTAELPYEVTLPEPITNYVAVTAGSDFGREYLIRTQALTDKGFRYEQKEGRSCPVLKPWIMLRSTDTGAGISAMLGYSGNWIIEVMPHGKKTVVRVDSVPSGLKPFTTVGSMPLPGVIVADFRGEWDNGAIPITRFIRETLVHRQRDTGPLVMWNTWFDEYDNLSETLVIKGARAAAELGCELVVIDAGWYGAGSWGETCGDWVVNKERFPNGLEPVIKEVRSLGLQFGLWTEIESASTNSPVGREHPDWFLRIDGRLVSERSVLDFSKPEVIEWAKSVLARLMNEYQLDYIKNDFNTDIHVNSSEPGYSAGDPLYYHYKGLAKFWRDVRAAYPNLIIENCSSGSLRHEALTASQSETHWVSDEVGNNYNLGAVFGATYLFPPETCLHWTCYPNASADLATDLAAQFAVSMMGHLGFSSKIYQWDAQTRDVCARQVALYKEIRPIIRNADVYHLTTQADFEKPTTAQAALYVDSKHGRAVLFAFQGGAEAMDLTTAMRGLKSKALYTVKMPEGYGSNMVVTGEELMETGVTIKFTGKGASAIIRIQEMIPPSEQ